MAQSSAPPQPAIVWRAVLPNGIGHAFPRTGKGPALCGVPNQDRRFDYGSTSRCGLCRSAATASGLGL